MRVAVHQPHYLPWLGYFDKMEQVDCFVILDDVQFEKNAWQNRNRIKTASGWQWLSVPVRHRFPQIISEVRVDNAVSWSRKHLHAVIVHYAGTPFFQVYRPFLEELYCRQWRLLVDLSLATIAYLADALTIRTKTLLASSLGLRGPQGPTDRLVAICRALGADTYLSGTGATTYLDIARFEAAGVRVLFQAFECPPYPQRFGGFVPNLSVLDLLLNCGGRSLEVLKGGRAHDERPGDRRAS